jgi:hypothetical protein
MSDNKPNWVDYANLASNFANLASNLTQNVQLQQIHSTLSNLALLQAELAKLDVSKAQATEREDRLREHVWRMEKAFDEAIRTSTGGPCGHYVITRQIQDGIARCGITSASFCQFGDKDRLGQLFDHLQLAIDTSVAKMTEDQRRDADTFIRYQVEVAELESSIEREREFGATDDDMDEDEDWLKQTQKLRGLLESDHHRSQEDDVLMQHLLMLEKYKARGIPDFLRHKKEREGFLLQFRQANNL